MRPAVVRMVESSGPTGNGKPTCRKGHELTPENVYNPPGTNHRKCLVCYRAWEVARRRSRRVVPQIESLPGEEWREVPGWEGFYAVSNMGRIKSLARAITSSNGVVLNRQERLMVIKRDRAGYCYVVFSRDGKGRRHAVHRAVLLAFLGPAPAGTEGCHNDGVRDHNELSNLRWDTRSNNIRDTVAHGNHPAASKTHCVNGHEFTPENTYWRPAGWRSCRKCKQDYKRRVRMQRKEAA